MSKLFFNFLLPIISIIYCLWSAIYVSNHEFQWIDQWDREYNFAIPIYYCLGVMMVQFFGFLLPFLVFLPMLIFNTVDYIKEYFKKV